MKIALAQIKPFKGDIEKNIRLHMRFIELAIAQQADAIFFPELSLTSYEPALAEELQLDINDDRFHEFQQLSNENNILIGLGFPLRVKEGVRISMLILSPGKASRVYDKQILHEDEKPYFVEGKKQMLIEYKGNNIAPAICYESLQKAHLENALQMGGTIYLASVAKDQQGIKKAETYYSKAAKANAIPIMMVNSIGYCDNFESAGQSAIWGKDGILQAKLPNNEGGLLVYDMENHSIINKTR